MLKKTLPLFGLLAGLPVAAQTIITVGDGEILTEQDLINGSFGGQSFTLSPDTKFEVQSGGRLGPLGAFGSFPSFINRTVDFGGATAHLLDGALASTSNVENLNLVFDGGRFGLNSRALLAGTSRLAVRSSYGPGDVRVSRDTTVDVFSSFSPEGVLQIERETELNLIVSELEVDGVLVTPASSVPFSEVASDSTSYSATFADGTNWTFETQSVFSTGRRDRIPDGVLVVAKRATSGVPEPGTALLAALACLGGWGRRP